jgi:hypothetical protein
MKFYFEYKKLDIPLQIPINPKCSLPLKKVSIFLEEKCFLLGDMFLMECDTENYFSNNHFGILSAMRSFSYGKEKCKTIICIFAAI